MADPNELSFAEFITSFRRGELLAQADTRLNELIDAIHETGGNGNLTITFPFKTNKSGQIECTPAIAIKKPRPVLGTGIFYATDAGRLSRRDPNQGDMLDELEARRSKS
jgi:hypothetical protein